jgi:hypothetical protein
VLIRRRGKRSSRNWLLAPLPSVDLQIWPPRDGTNAPITMQHEQANIQTNKYTAGGGAKVLTRRVDWRRSNTMHVAGRAE